MIILNLKITSVVVTLGVRFCPTKNCHLWSIPLVGFKVAPLVGPFVGPLIKKKETKVVRPKLVKPLVEA